MQIGSSRRLSVILRYVLVFLLASAVPVLAEDWKAKRAEAANRPRPLIVNNDGNDALHAKEVSRDALLSQRSAGLLGSQVRSIFYSTSDSFGLFKHGTKVGSVRGPENMGVRLIQGGLDPLAITAEFAHQNGLEIFWSFRVNDIHDAWSKSSEQLEHNRFKRDHPELLLRNHSRMYSVRNAVNYAEPAVRQAALDFLTEVCQNYDVDGIELDFWRHLAYFPSTANRLPCNEDELNAMTEFLQSLRAMTEREGRKRGRPILIAIRVPDSVEFCKAIGIDLEKWLADDLVDILVAGGNFQLNPWSYSAELARKHGKKFYASLDDPRVDDKESNSLRRSSATHNGRAMEAWKQGADGIYVYNYWINLPTDKPFWREAGDPVLLNVRDKNYFSSALGGTSKRRYSDHGLPYEPYFNISTLNPDNPVALPPGQETILTFPCWDDFKAAESQGHTPSLTLKLRVKDGSIPPQAAYQINGKPANIASQKEEWLSFSVTPEDIEQGVNRLTVSLPPDSGEEVKALDLVLQVRYGTGG